MEKSSGMIQGASAELQVAARKVAVIFNLAAGSANYNRVRAIGDSLAEAGIEVGYFPTTASKWSARRLALNAVNDGADTVVAVGGDGTAAEVAGALAGSDVPMAVYPGGTTNVFARTYYSGMTAQMFAGLIANGFAQSIDLIKAEYFDQDTNRPVVRYALTGLCTGKMADAITGASVKLKRLLGAITYAIRIGRVLLDPRSEEITLVGEGREWSQKALVTVALNVAGPWLQMLMRGCNASDGLLDFASFEADSLIQVCRSLFWLALGSPQRSGCCTMLRMREVTVRSESAFSLNIDGEACGRTRKLTLGIEREAVKVLVARTHPQTEKGC